MPQHELLKIWLEFIEKFVGSLAWPAVALTTVLLFRKELLALMPTLKKLKLGILEGEFEVAAKETLHKVEAVTDPALPQPEPPPVQEPPPEPGVEHAPIDFSEATVSTSPLIQPVNKLLLYANPGAAIQIAWENIQRAMLSLISERGVYVAPRHTSSPGTWIVALEKERVLNDEQITVLKEMFELRNQVVHTRTIPTVEAAVAYVEASERLTRTLLRKARKS
ncbi:hypothetical protein WIX39_022575 [Variovorax sp. AB1(2024)]|uniref:hypothetical protein n=1 Tax=Variovorax sp. AB1(2024) TaxID=3132214 RepID=UPI0030A6EC8B